MPRRKIMVALGAGGIFLLAALLAARHVSPRIHRSQAGFLMRAAVGRDGAARSEPAPGLDAGRGRNVPFERYTHRPARRVGHGHSRQKRLSVWVQRIGEERIGRSFLDDHTEVHDRNTRACMTDHGEIVGDEQVCRSELLLKLGQKVQDLGVPIFLHPTNTPITDLMPDFYLSNLVGYPTETALAAAHLMFGGVLEMFPHLHICLAHGGGTLPALLGRLRHGARVRPEIRGTTANAPMDLAGRFYYDSLTHSVRALHFLVEMVGCNRLLLGSDYPFDMRDRDPVVAVNSLVGPTQKEIDGILGGNAAALLKLS